MIIASLSLLSQQCMVGVEDQISVVDPALIWLSWIWILIGDPDPEACKLTKSNL